MRYGLGDDDAAQHGLGDDATAMLLCAEKLEREPDAVAPPSSPMAVDSPPRPGGVTLKSFAANAAAPRRLADPAADAAANPSGWVASVAKLKGAKVLQRGSPDRADVAVLPRDGEGRVVAKLMPRERPYGNPATDPAVLRAFIDAHLAAEVRGDPAVVAVGPTHVATATPYAGQTVHRVSAALSRTLKADGADPGERIVEFARCAKDATLSALAPLWARGYAHGDAKLPNFCCLPGQDCLGAAIDMGESGPVTEEGIRALATEIVSHAFPRDDHDRAVAAMVRVMTNHADFDKSGFTFFYYHGPPHADDPNPDPTNLAAWAMGLVCRVKWPGGKRPRVRPVRQDGSDAVKHHPGDLPDEEVTLLAQLYDCLTAFAFIYGNAVTQCEQAKLGDEATARTLEEVEGLLGEAARGVAQGELPRAAKGDKRPADEDGAQGRAKRPRVA